MGVRQRSLTKFLSAIGVTVAVVCGVTYAAFMSNSAVIGANTITTASANLQVSIDGVHFSDWVTGFRFSDLVPGQQATGDNQIYMKNVGSTPLDLQLAMSQPQYDANIYGPVDMEKFYLSLAADDTTQSHEYSLATLTDGQTAPLGVNLAPNQQIHYNVQMRMDDGAVFHSTESVTMNNFDIIFSAKAGGA